MHFGACAGQQVLPFECIESNFERDMANCERSSGFMTLDFRDE
jgi:hypothetical protein